MKRKSLFLIIFFCCVIVANNIFWVVYNSTNTKKTPSLSDSLIISSSTNYDETNRYYQFKRDILLRGNVKSFEKLRDPYSLCWTSDLCLVWSLVLANKHDKGEGYFGVFFDIACANNYYDLTDEYRSPGIRDSLTGVWYVSLDSLDEKTRKMALEYLVKASDKKNKRAMEYLGAYYILGKYFPKNIDLGNKLIEESKKNDN